MDSLRDVALKRLAVAEQLELLRLGAAARLADDDFVWILLAAAIRLDLDRFTRIATSHVRARSEHEVTQLVDRAAERITDLTRYAIKGARWERPAHKLALVAATALILMATHLSVFALAERGWIGYLREEIAGLRTAQAELAKNLPPNWLTWSATTAGERVAFVARTVNQIELRNCSLAGKPGTCLQVK
ncbi:MAG: hypothetical protein H7A19_18680 [Rhodanobacteraceae bacterium]|nr:hypothetical protein [Rhodanobacteraceae bacterium]